MAYLYAAVRRYVNLDLGSGVGISLRLSGYGCGRPT